MRFAAILALALAACGPQGTGAPPAEPEGIAGGDRRAAVALAVEAEGLRLFDGASGAARPLPFGTGEDQLLAALAGARGPATRGRNQECPPGPLGFAAWPDGLTLHFQDGAFAGWALDERAAGVHATAAGIGPGSTPRDLESTYAAEIGESSLGTEFSASGLHGLLDGAGEEARIVAMWAGASCIFR